MATATPARTPTTLKYGDWVRERAPFEARLRAWNDAHPDETCVESVMAIKRPDPNDPSREETVLTEGLKSNFAVFSTERGRVHCVDARLALPGITLNALKRYAAHSAAGVDECRGPILSDVERGAYDELVQREGDFSAIRGDVDRLVSRFKPKGLFKDVSFPEPRGAPGGLSEAETPSLFGVERVFYPEGVDAAPY